MELTLRPRSMRARFRLALFLLVAIIVANIAFLSWSGREREQVFEQLHQAIDRHAALNEAALWIDDHQQQILTVRDLPGEEGRGIGEAEEGRILTTIAANRDALHAAVAGTDDQALARIEARVDSLTGYWTGFYLNLRSAPESARILADEHAAPLAAELLSRDLPAAIRAQDSRVQLANSAFAAGDRQWSRTVRLILLLSAGLFGGMSWLTSRDLIRAVDALKMGADRFGAAELSHRVTVENFDELEEVGQRMNTMAHRLERAREELAVRNEELALMAFRDPLTKLSNRALFRERVEQALHATRSPSCPTAPFSGNASSRRCMRPSLAAAMSRSCSLTSITSKR